MMGAILSQHAPLIRDYPSAPPPPPAPIDLSATARSNNLHLTLTGNVSSFALTNPTDGAVYNIRFIQDGTGSRTFAGFPSAFKFPGGVDPEFSTTASAVDFMSCQYGSTEATYMCSFLAGMA